jgi:uncharacterized protein (DUF983 family)
MVLSEILPARAVVRDRDAKQAMLRGLRELCPRCGRGDMFSAYLKVADHCPHCGEALLHQRADDAPPYVTMMIVGHILIAGMAFTDDMWSPPSWVHAVIWIPLAIASSLLLLPRVKGAIVGLQWANRMHGFAET